MEAWRPVADTADRIPFEGSRQRRKNTFGTSAFAGLRRGALVVLQGTVFA